MKLEQDTPFPHEFYDQLALIESSHWWFLSRNKILLWVIRRYVGDFKKFLEVGCGTGFVTSEIHRHFPDAEISGGEYHPQGLEYARKRVPTGVFKQIDACQMGEQGAYDLIGAFDVVEHIKSDSLAIENMAAALKDGGSLLLTVPQHQWLWSQADEYACHERRYSKKQLVDLVNGTGLDVVLTTSFVSLLVPLMYLSRLGGKGKEYDPVSEFKIPRWLNAAMKVVLNSYHKCITSTS